GDWKAVHIHQSTPDDRLAGLAAFNAEVARNTYNKISDVIKKEARTDSMTRINNMEGFVEQAQHIFKSYPDQKFAVIKFGIRDFRFINRTYGFSTGDRLLKTIARNLEEACGRREACGRIEKDTFSILLVYEGENSMRRRMEEIRRELTKDGWIKEIGLEVWLNAGIYIPADTRAETVKGMLDKALMAMQSIRKYVKEDRYAYYSDWMLQQHYNNSQILEWASSAIEKKEFKLYIQPQFDMKTENIVGGEALCRWQLSNGLVIMPNEFVPLFEDYNLIYRFDLYMLELVCSYMNKWMKEGKQLKPVSVNQSRADIEQDSFFEDFCSIVDRYEIPHEYLTFELTESAFIEEGNRIMKLARELHRKGFKLAIDDFGTGYASLNMLSVVSGDILKIDKSLLESDNRRTRVIFEKVIEMAHSMDMKVVCEGVETQEQRKLLCMLNCDIGQGFLAGKAMKAEDYGKRYIKRRL
ncbi:EAL domain-containing protein, partial [[Clostridium] scindens]